jgi:hypothetical protein
MTFQNIELTQKKCIRSRVNRPGHGGSILSWTEEDCSGLEKDRSGPEGRPVCLWRKAFRAPAEGLPYPGGRPSVPRRKAVLVP